MRLEYAVERWHQTIVKDKYKLGKTERQLTKMLPKIKGQTGEDRMLVLRLFPSEFGKVGRT